MGSGAREARQTSALHEQWVDAVQVTTGHGVHQCRQRRDGTGGVCTAQHAAFRCRKNQSVM
jgi:hypothetical protein